MSRAEANWLNALLKIMRDNYNAVIQELTQYLHEEGRFKGILSFSKYAAALRRQASKHHDVAMGKLQQAIASPLTTFGLESPQDYVEDEIMRMTLRPKMPS